MKFALLFIASWSIVTARGQQLQFDASFPGNTGASGAVFCVQALPNDRVVLAGDFTHYAGQPARSVVRILPSGQRDTTFQMGTGASGRVNSMRVASNGDVILAGLFETYNGAASKNIVKVLANGQRDTSFNVGTGLNNEVLGMEAYADGSVLVGGFFGQFRGLSVTQPLKIASTGQRDTAFNAGGTGTVGLIEVIRRQQDDKILLAGTITQYNGQPVGRGIIRLLPNGQRDTTFNTGSGLASGSFRAMELQSDGKIVLAGNFSSFNGTPVQRLIRLHPNGQLDSSFLINTPFTATIVSIVVRKNGNIVAFGNYSQVVGQLPHAIAEFSPNGMMLTQPGLCVEMNSVVQDAAELSDSSLVVGGSFTVAGGTNRPRVGRLVNVTGMPAAPPVLSATQTVVCPGTTISMLATGSLAAGSQWVWYAGACGQQAVGTGDSLALMPSQTTTYFVRAESACTAAGNCGSITIVVGDTLPPVPSQPNLPLAQAFCSLSLTPPTALSGCGQVISATTNDATTFTAPGNYQVQWTYTNAFGNSSTQIQQVQIDTVDVRVNHVYFDFEALNTAASAYQWLDCSNGMQPIAGATARTFNSAGPGVFAVAITQGGCTDTSACYSILSNAVEDAFWQGLALYPNPAKNQVTLTFEAALVLQLRDLQGRLLFRHESKGGMEQLVLPALAAGLYTWEIEHGSRRIYKRQVIY